MVRVAALIVILAGMILPAQAQQGRFSPWFQPDGAPVVGTVLLCATGTTKGAAPCGGPTSPMTVLSTPFVRSGSGDPIIFDGIGTTPKQFAISKPADATSYRFFNPCNVDVRIRKVGSLTEEVTFRTGYRFGARTSETLGTSGPAFVSLMTTAAPTGDCSPELHYGNGG